MKKESTPELPIRVVKIGSCPTLSGRSELTYHLGRHEDESIYLRVVQNTGNGQFNPDWVALMQIEKLLAEHPVVMSNSRNNALSPRAVVRRSHPPRPHRFWTTAARCTYQFVARHLDGELGRLAQLLQRMCGMVTRRHE